MPQKTLIPVILGTKRVPKVARTHANYIKTVKAKSTVNGKRVLNTFTVAPNTRGTVTLKKMRRVAPYIGDEKGEKIIFYKKKAINRAKKPISLTNKNIEFIMTKPRRKRRVKKVTVAVSTPAKAPVKKILIGSDGQPLRRARTIKLGASKKVKKSRKRLILPTQVVPPQIISMESAGL